MFLHGVPYYSSSCHFFSSCQVNLILFPRPRCSSMVFLTIPPLVMSFLLAKLILYFSPVPDVYSPPWCSLLFFLSSFLFFFILYFLSFPTKNMLSSIFFPSCSSASLLFLTFFSSYCFLLSSFSQFRFLLLLN